MRKFLAASLIVVALAGATLLVHTTVIKADKVVTAPLKPDSAKVIYEKNDSKVFKTPDEFISLKSDNLHNRKDAEKVIRAKVLYKNIKLAAPDVNDVMHWVDPDRQIYVVASKFKSFETLMGVLTDATVYTYFDAETGDELGADYKGTPSEEYKKNANKH